MERASYITANKISIKFVGINIAQKAVSFKYSIKLK